MRTAAACLSALPVADSLAGWHRSHAIAVWIALSLAGCQAQPAGLVEARASVDAGRASAPKTLSQTSLVFDAVSIVEVSGNGDGQLDPGERVSATVRLRNGGPATASALIATLIPRTAVTTMVNATSSFPNIAANATGQNAVPFTFDYAAGAPCAAAVAFDLFVRAADDAFTANVPVSIPRATMTATASYAGPPIAIADAPSFGALGPTIEAPITIAGPLGALTDIDVRFDGTACTTEVNATTVGLAHTFVGDVWIELVSPGGRSVQLQRFAAQEARGGVNYCQTRFDDSAPVAIRDTDDAEPWTGSYRPFSPLSAFVGESSSGTWRIRMTDTSPGDVGTFYAASLIYTTPRCTFLPDAGPPDAGPPDAGPPDGGPPDAGPDAGPPDAGTLDAGTPDIGPPDAGEDASRTDAGALGEVPDAGGLDAGASIDAGVRDAGPPDAGSLPVADATRLDASVGSTAGGGGCSCRVGGGTSSTGSIATSIAALALLTMRRRRPR